MDKRGSDCKKFKTNLIRDLKENAKKNKKISWMRNERERERKWENISCLLRKQKEIDK